MIPLLLLQPLIVRLAFSEDQGLNYFNGKVVWVTGASSGIGEALAVQLSRRGARLVLSARRQDALERVRDLCQDAASHLVLPMDLENEGSFDAAVQAILARMGRIDVLINNGGISQRSLVEDTSMAVYRRLMEVNYFGAVALSKAVLPVMRQQGGGHIAVTASIAGLVSTPLRSGYGPAKAAIIAFCDSLRAEVSRDNILVTAACPGGVKTDVSLNALAGDGSKHGKMDEIQEKGLTADECARQMLDGMAARKGMVLIAGKEKLAVYLKRMSPDLVAWLLTRMKVT